MALCCQVGKRGPCVTAAGGGEVGALQEHGHAKRSRRRLDSRQARLGVGPEVSCVCLAVVGCFGEAPDKLLGGCQGADED